MKSFFTFWGRVAIGHIIMTASLSLYKEGLSQTSIVVALLAMMFYVIAVIKYKPAI